jgi:hypothetical protein
MVVFGVFILAFKMAIEVFPSSFYCGCGHKSYFFENTVSEMEKMSKTKLEPIPLF